MPEGFAFEIVGDASKADRAISGVVAGLDKITPRAQRAGQAITSAIDHAAAVVAKHGQAQTQAASAAQKLVAQLEREQQVFDRLRGPLHERAADMQALNALVSKGAITVHEYTAEVERMRNATMAANQNQLKAPARGGFDLSSVAGSLPGGSVIAGAVGGGVAGAAQAGIQTAVQGAQQIVQMADAYQGLNNRLRAMTGSQEAAVALFDKLEASANRTYSDVETTTSAFIRMNRALQGLGVSQNQVLAFTEHLNMTIAQSGTDSAGAQAALLQLGQALSAGALRGDEFNSIIEQAPALLEPIAQKLGVSTGQLRAMAEQGKLTSQIIFDAYEGQGGAGSRIERAFGDAVPTVGQQFQVLKNEAFKLVGQFAQDIELSKLLAEGLNIVRDAAEVAGAQFKVWIDLYKEAKKYGFELGDVLKGGYYNFKEFSEAIDFNNAFLGRSADLHAQLKVAILASARAAQEATEANRGLSASLVGGVHDLIDTTGKLIQITTSKDAIGRMIDPWFQATEAVKKHRAELTDLEKLYQSLHGPTEQAYKDLANLEVLYAQGRISLGMYNQELAKRNDLLAAARLYELEGMGGVHSMPTAGLGQRAGGMDVVPGVPEAPASATMSKQQAESLTRMWHEQLGKIETDNQRTAGMIVDVWKPVENALVSAITSGKFAWDDFAKSMESSLANIAVKLLEAAALTALLGPGGGSGSFGQALYKGVIGGGKNGFDYTVGSSGLQLPGFQSGGSITRQAGGPEPLLAMWWMQPNETLSIRTEEQQRRAQQGAGAPAAVARPTSVLINMQNDRRDLVHAMDSRDGERILVNLDRKMRRRGR